MEFLDAVDLVEVDMQSAKHLGEHLSVLRAIVTLLSNKLNTDGEDALGKCRKSADFGGEMSKEKKS